MKNEEKAILTLVYYFNPATQGCNTKQDVKDKKAELEQELKVKYSVIEDRCTVVILVVSSNRDEVVWLA
jgi:hypothetical protein